MDTEGLKSYIGALTLDLFAARGEVARLMAELKRIREDADKKAEPAPPESTP